MDISAQETNSIFGAISSKNEGSSVSVDGKTNTVRSYAVISNAGNLNSATDDKFKDNHVLKKMFIMLGLISKPLKESAWYEGSAVRYSGRAKNHIIQFKFYKYLRYIKKTVYFRMKRRS